MDAAIDEGCQRGSGHKVIAKKGIKLSMSGDGNFAISRYPFKRTEGSKICYLLKIPKYKSPSRLTQCKMPLQNNQNAVLNKLRIVCTHKILTWDYNRKKKMVTAEQHTWPRGRKLLDSQS
uniref:Uncharacterized protein n=1 Tax=Daucus carota subsp. sativus TaxID=79200 RepID=A0A164WG51_DAUCS